MFNELISALLHETLRVVKNHPDFFEKKEAEREAVLENSELPKLFKSYLVGLSEHSFMKEISAVTRMEWRGTGFLECFSEFLVGPVASKLDQLTGDYYSLSTLNRRQVVDKLIRGNHAIARALKDLFLYKNPQTFGTGIQKILDQRKNRSFVVVQSPIEIPAELKKDIRETLREQDEFAYAHFQINRRLVGGLRVFKDGHVADHSWLSRLLRFTSLTTS